MLAARAFADAAGFEPRAGRSVLLPGNGGLAGVLFGIEAADELKDPFLPGLLSPSLPPGVYRFATIRTTRGSRHSRLRSALTASRAIARRRRREVSLDPAAERGPRRTRPHRRRRDAGARPHQHAGQRHGAGRTGGCGRARSPRATVPKSARSSGDDLLTQNFPLIHAVGRASERSPRLIELTWGDANHPRVTLVGKGVCFDSGGLDIKPDSAMLLMKKDMGGAATVLALAHMIMDRGLKVRLSVLIPAVENSISGSAFRPRDVYAARNGLTVEVGNTDAEGRLVLADALALADEDAPDLLIDMGTLTGAARVALGPDVPPFYTDDEALAAALARHAFGEHDPVWRLPLWMPYSDMLDSKVADLNNVSSGSFAGSIICALFLKRFVRRAKSWLHLDIYAWTPASKPGRPEGGECQTARALYALLAERYA